VLAVVATPGPFETVEVTDQLIDAQQPHRAVKPLVELVVDQAAVTTVDHSTGLSFARAHPAPSGGRWRSSISASRAARREASTPAAKSMSPGFQIAGAHEGPRSHHRRRVVVLRGLFFMCCAVVSVGLAQLAERRGVPARRHAALLTPAAAPSTRTSSVTNRFHNAGACQFHSTAPS
jgi:hypothetical protein